MTEQRVAGAFDFEVLRRAIEERDADTLAGLYTDNARLRIVNHNTTPSFASLLVGRGAIAGHLEEICGREMTHRIEREVVGEERVAFEEVCEYPDGTRLLCAALLDVEDGRIARQTNVEAWDWQ
jgi:hypothetical protein